MVRPSPFNWFPHYWSTFSVVPPLLLVPSSLVPPSPFTGPPLTGFPLLFLPVLVFPLLVLLYWSPLTGTLFIARSPLTGPR